MTDLEAEILHLVSTRGPDAVIRALAAALRQHAKDSGVSRFRVLYAGWANVKLAEKQTEARQ